MTHGVHYIDGTTFVTLTVPWDEGTGWPGHIDWHMTVTHEVRRFVHDGDPDEDEGT